MKIPMNKCKKNISILWFSYSCILFFVILLQSLFGHYGDNVSEVWGWFLPTIMPTLSLILSVLLIDALEKDKKDKKIDKFIYRLALCLSIAYFISISLTIFIQPFITTNFFKLISQSNLFLGPLQGLVSGSIGAFFVKAKSVTS